MTNTHRSKGFTLIELLVVITIIGILATIAIPVFGNVQRTAIFTKALAEARGVGLALAQFASDNDSKYPLYADESDAQGLDGLVTGTTPLTNSNQAFRNLLAGGYISREKVFSIQGDPWITRNDDNFKPLDTSRTLAVGENSYAYVRGFSSTSDGAWPLIANAFAGNAGSISAPAYATTGLKGGVFDGKKCVVIRCDISAEGSLKIQPTSRQVLQPDGVGNFFEQDIPNSWCVGGEVLNPQ